MSAESEEKKQTPASKPADAEKKPAAPEFARPEREDDDGYDPWSDRRESTPLFERDPWD